MSTCNRLDLQTLTDYAQKSPRSLIHTQWCPYDNITKVASDRYRLVPPHCLHQLIRHEPSFTFFVRSLIMTLSIAFEVLSDLQ
jgi:hypothetical protein